MKYSGNNSDTNQPKSYLFIWFRQNVEESSEKKSRNIFKVIQMSPTNSFDICVFFYFYAWTQHVFGILDSLEKEYLI